MKYASGSSGYRTPSLCQCLLEPSQILPRRPVLRVRRSARTTPLNHRDRPYNTWPHKLVFVLPPVETVPEPDAPGDVKVCSRAGHDMPAVVSAVIMQRERKTTAYHQPWPSRKIPQGKPICLLHLLSVGQNMLSSVQMANPLRNMLNPYAIIIHMCRNIFSSRRSILSCSTFLTVPVPFGWSTATDRPVYLSEGLMLTSITYMARKRTMAVSRAYMF